MYVCTYVYAHIACVRGPCGAGAAPGSAPLPLARRGAPPPRRPDNNNDNNINSNNTNNTNNNNNNRSSNSNNTTTTTTNNNNNSTTDKSSTYDKSNLQDARGRPLADLRHLRPPASL